jgi:OPA family glycerol-3-phosphate transporter-like MFS transporter/OPA family sugar phosphate sensor protein UhpC-like MFS transporter
LSVAEVDSAGERNTSKLPRFLRPPPPAQPIHAEPEEIRRITSHYRSRILFWTTTGYGTFYFVRKNLSVAMPIIGEQLGISKAMLGLILTVHEVVYGISKFVNGMVADRANARILMSMALLVSAVLNICFGLSSAALFFGIFWMLNGLFQGMGYPPCARLLTHWFGPKELATKMSIWNASHSIGGGAIVILCGYLISHYGHEHWRLCFFVPSAIAVAMAALLFLNLRDTPESIGLPEVEGTHQPDPTNSDESPEEFRQFIWRKVFSNKYIWLISGANFFVYTIRLAVLDWAPTFLKEAKGISLGHASLIVAGFEFAGLGGMLVSGWLTDRVCKGRANPVSLVWMLLCGAAIFCFWRAPVEKFAINATLLMAIGFFIYGPQALVAVAVANLATKKAAATAVGLTSIFGYASTVLSGWGLGLLVQHYGWNRAFPLLIGIAMLGAILFAAALPAKAHGYGDEE